MKRRLPYSAAFLAGVMVLALLSGCNRNKDAKDGAASADVPVFPVNTSSTVQGQIWDYLALSGDVEAGTTVDVYSDVAGKVSRLYVDVGSQVYRDAPVAAVDPSKPGMTYVPGIAKAPITGIVVSLPAQMGMTVTQTVPLARIAGSVKGNALEIKLHVAERFISKMALALPCMIILDAYPGESFRGSITEISPVVDPASRTMEVKVNVDNPGSRIKAGMFAKVRVITEQKEGIVKIPASAMVERFGKNYVFTVETDPTDPAFKIVRRKEVTLGILIDGVLEIQSGLSPNEEIVVRGQTLLEDGSRVNVIEKTAPLSADH
ncbi:MAG: efflux RND transporter periplasmic adaptor subunit [Treponema sp.]|jgi:multidrug efflux pump subunit AcrA (membrane-fusion protein)|nr:efflux RND transporter periplasmic adaptor subunit [Treponema sp.]